MATYGCVMFGHILYDDKLTWEELLKTEARVTRLMQGALEEFGAHHIDFISLADALLVECVFAEVDRDTNHALCDAVIRELGSSVLARFMFVDRQMDSTVFYFLGRGKWQEQALNVPGPREALSGWVVRQERKASDRVLPPNMPPRTRQRAAPLVPDLTPELMPKVTPKVTQDTMQSVDTVDVAQQNDASPAQDGDLLTEMESKTAPKPSTKKVKKS